MKGQNTTPSKLQQYIREQEEPLRASEFPTAVVDEVLRYGGFIGSSIEHHDVLERAMTYGQNLIYETEQSGKSIPSGTVIFAEKLYKSKGRFDRSWYAPEGGLWGCLILADTFLPHTRFFLPLAVGVACCEAVRESGVRDCTIRWVNDVLVDKLKLAGFLIEGHTSKLCKDEFFLVGFGINLNNRSFPKELENLAVSLYDVTGKEIDVHRFALTFLAKLTWNIGLLYFEEANELRGDGFSGKNSKHLLLQKWEELTDCIGKRVKFGINVIDNPQYEATVTGIKKDGGLIMRFDDGSNIVQYSGEIRYLEE